MKRLTFETLEERSLLTTWIPQGPGPAIDGQVENITPDNEVVGAIHTVIAHPTDADILYIGGTNGGIWKTTNATAASPSWVPLIDDLPSLSIGALELDLNDPTSQTIVAGIGHASSYGRVGGDLVGLLKTTDGGNNWTQLGTADLTGRSVTGLMAQGNTIVVSANNFGGGTGGGVYRSTDGGANFSLASGTGGLATGAAWDLVVDPTDLNRLYVSVDDTGIFRSDDLGVTWTNVSAGDASLNAAFTSGGNNNAEMAVSLTTGRLFAAVLINGQATYIGFTDNQGGSWTEMDLPISLESDGDGEGLNPRVKPGGQGAIHFSIRVDPVDANTIYVGGDRQDLPFPNAIGASDFSGRLFRGDTSVAPVSPGDTNNFFSPQWEHLTHDQDLGFAGGGTLSGSAPHADSREMVFDANGDLIEVDDGGIYRRTNPQDNTGDWFSIIGNLQVTEAHDVAYDNNSNIIITGNQDTGTTEQTASGSTTFNSVSTADGGDVAVDNLVGGGVSVRYSSFQNLAAFRRRTVDDANNTIATVFPALDSGLDPPISPQFVTPVVVNEGQANRLIIGGSNGVYESFDGGDSVQSISTSSVNSFNGAPIAYGTEDNPEALYVGSGTDVLVRTVAAGALSTTSPGGGSIRDVAMDPSDFNTAVAVDFDQVFLTDTTGTSWTDITGNLFTSFGVNGFHALEYLADTGEDIIFVGTERGVYSTTDANLGTWELFGTDLANAPVWDLDFDATDDVLVAGTLGRGAWILEDASTALLGAIEGSKWNDLDGDGIRDGGEPGLEGWTIFIDLNENGQRDEDEPFDVTDADGNYSIGGLTAGTYVVAEVIQPNFSQTFPSEGVHTVVLSVGQTVSGIDFGNEFVGVQVSGLKFEDINENGQRDANEPGLQNWQIFADLNENGVLNGGEPRTLTDAGGKYTLAIANPGTYTIRERLKPGWFQTLPADGAGHIVTLADEGDSVAGINFGNAKLPPGITGLVWNDRNGNGARDAGEPGLGNVFVYVDRDRDGNFGVGEPAAVTARDGTYQITGLSPRTYVVRQVIKPGWLQSYPSNRRPQKVFVPTADQGALASFGSVPARDFGDAPILYPTRRDQDGARHRVVPGFHLGPGAPGVTMVDTEPNGQADAGAAGDDLDLDGDDEDGVDWLGDTLVAGTNKTIRVYGSPAQDIVRGKLQAWIDFNADGDWSDAGEQIITDEIIATGSNLLTFSVPANAVAGPTYARFRISYAYGLSYDGLATEGEVEDYLVSIDSPFIPFGVEAIDLGLVGDVPLTGVDVSNVSTWFKATAALSGMFTVDASFANAAGNIDIAVFDSDQALVGQSSSLTSNERVDFDSVAGQMYFVRLLGTNPDVDLRFVNVVSLNSPVTFVGTDADDTVVFVAGPRKHRVTFNGLRYEFDAAAHRRFVFQGNGGEDSAVIRLATGNATATMHPGAMQLNATGYALDVAGIETMRVYAGEGFTRAHLYDSSSDDVFLGKPAHSLLRGPGFYNLVKGFDRVYAYATAGESTDRAYLYDSVSDDRFVGRPEYGLLRGGEHEYYNQAQGFDRVYAYATAGGLDDRAYLYDSSANDRFIGRPDYSLIRSEDNDYYNYARGFNRVYAYATAGGLDDRAFLYDSESNDRYIGRPEYSLIRNEDNDYYNYARGFNRVYAYATAGGLNDRAYLYDSSGNDRFIGRPDYSLIRSADNDYYNYARGFNRVYAYATAGGSDDRAYLYDSSGNDRFLGRSDYSVLRGKDNEYYNYARGFERVYAYATAGGYDRADVYDSEGNDRFTGAGSLFYLQMDEPDLQGRGFDYVKAHGVNGGTNQLEVGTVDYLFSQSGDWL